MHKLINLILESNQVYFTPQSKGKSKNRMVDYRQDLCWSISRILGIKPIQLENLILSKVTIPDNNIMHVQFQYNDHTYDVTFERTDRWVAQNNWKGSFIIDDIEFKFPFSPSDNKKIKDILFSNVEQAEHLLREYDYYWQYIDYGAIKVKNANDKIISAVQKLHLSTQQLLSVLKKVFGRSQEEFEGMKKIFKL